MNDDRAQRFSGKTVLIAGGAQGMGRACAEMFAAEGAQVALFDIESDSLARTRYDLSALGYSIEAICGDTSSSSDVDRAVATAVGRFGTIDVLVHTPAVVEIKPLLEISEERWRRIIDVNLTGAFLTTRAVGRVMAERGGGSIVVFGSTNAFFAEELNVPYSASKGGVVMFVRNAAMDLARHGIRVNAINPGIIDTRLSAALVHDPEAGPEYLKRIPIGRYGTPEDIAKVALFLASSDAGYMTGADVVVDGGLTLGATLGIESLNMDSSSAP
jgi:NAD(P)-dependent dehydrogenase (short-subunit alcohol dehydrogenase family)